MSLAKPRGARDYRGTIAGLDNVEIAYLSASEIASQLARGMVHLGVTGEDLVRESIADADKRVLLIDNLGFGSANVVVAVPQAWIDVRTMADLDDVTTGFRAQHNRRMRVATKYINLTRTFFAAHGVVDYRIVESAGATEGAPAVGTAEMIVDITTTGATLAANGLKVLDDGVILRSQANLVASRDADWSAEARETARVILDHIAAAPAPASTAKSAPALPAATRRCWPKPITASAWSRRSAGRPRPGWSRCTARRRSFTRSAASFATTAPTRCRWRRWTMCSTATIRCSPGLRRSCGANTGYVRSEITRCHASRRAPKGARSSA